MADCDHTYTLDKIEDGPAPGAPRIAWLMCTTCQHGQPVYTTRSDEQIQAELEAQG
jgi:hypothetical protein